VPQDKPGVRAHGPQRSRGRGHLWAADVVGAEQRAPAEVGLFYDVAVAQDQGAYSGLGQQPGYFTAQGAYAKDDHSRGAQYALIPAGNQGMPGVTVGHRLAC
jgi:hypothetical protein